MMLLLLLLKKSFAEGFSSFSRLASILRFCVSPFGSPINGHFIFTVAVTGRYGRVESDGGAFV